MPKRCDHEMNKIMMRDHLHPKILAGMEAHASHIEDLHCSDARINRNLIKSALRKEFIIDAKKDQ